MLFDSEFADGVRLVSSNYQGPRHWPDAPDTDHVRFPDVTDLAAVRAYLLDLQQRIVEPPNPRA